MQIAQYFENLGFGAELVTLIVSMIPVIELRGAIPVGVSLGLPVWKAALISVIGNLIPVPFIIVFIKAIFQWLRAKSKWLETTVSRLETRARRKAEKIRRGEFWGLMTFVAIPLPGTGAWTGALIAALMKTPLRRALPPIILGVLLAGLIVSLATAGVINLFV